MHDLTGFQRDIAGDQSWPPISESRRSRQQRTAGEGWTRQADERVHGHATRIAGNRGATWVGKSVFRRCERTHYVV